MGSRWTDFYFSCLDGSITCVRFLDGELGKVVTEDLIDQQLNRYGADRDSTVLPESVEQLQLEEKAKNIRSIAIRRMMPLYNTKVEKTEALVTRTSIDINKLRNQQVTVTKSGKNE